MDRLESHRDLETSGDRPGEVAAARTDETRVRFDGYGCERLEKSRERVEILRRHRSRVEEIAGVVQLDAVRRLAGAKPGERPAQLLRQRAAGRRTFECVPPEVAKRARERALAPCEENRQRALEMAARPPLHLREHGKGAPGIDGISGRAEGSNPPVLGGEAHGLPPRVEGDEMVPVTGLSIGKETMSHIGGPRAVLKSPLGEDRHVEAGDRRDATAHNLALESIETLGRATCQLAERDCFRDGDDGRPRVWAESREAVPAR